MPKDQPPQRPWPSSFTFTPSPNLPQHGTPPETVGDLPKPCWGSRSLLVAVYTFLRI